MRGPRRASAAGSGGQRRPGQAARYPPPVPNDGPGPRQKPTLSTCAAAAATPPATVTPPHDAGAAVGEHHPGQAPSQVGGEHEHPGVTAGVRGQPTATERHLRPAGDLVRRHPAGVDPAGLVGGDRERFDGVAAVALAVDPADHHLPGELTPGGGVEPRQVRVVRVRGVAGPAEVVGDHVRRGASRVAGRTREDRVPTGGLPRHVQPPVAAHRDPVGAAVRAQVTQPVHGMVVGPPPQLPLPVVGVHVGDLHRHAPTPAGLPEPTDEDQTAAVVNRHVADRATAQRDLGQCRAAQVVHGDGGTAQRHDRAGGPDRDPAGGTAALPADPVRRRVQQHDATVGRHRDLSARPAYLQVLDRVGQPDGTQQTPAGTVEEQHRAGAAPADRGRRSAGHRGEPATDHELAPRGHIHRGRHAAGPPQVRPGGRSEAARRPARRTGLRAVHRRGAQAGPCARCHRRGGPGGRARARGGGRGGRVVGPAGCVGAAADRQKHQGDPGHQPMT